MPAIMRDYTVDGGGGTGFAGNSRYSLGMNGANQYGARTEQIVTAYPFSMAIWFQTSTSAEMSVFDIADASAADVNYGIRVAATGELDIVVRNGGGWTRGRTFFLYDDGIWHLAIGVFVADNLRYIYGDEFDSDSDAGIRTFNAGVDTYSLGRYGDVSPSNYFNGSIDSVRVWDKALDAAERTSLWNNGVGSYAPVAAGNLVLSLKFGRGAGNTGFDDSGNGWDATLYNAPLWDMGWVPRQDPKTALVVV